jgi:hypothetical protein
MAEKIAGFIEKSSSLRHTKKIQKKVAFFE